MPFHCLTFLLHKVTQNIVKYSAHCWMDCTQRVSKLALHYSVQQAHNKAFGLVTAGQNRPSKHTYAPSSIYTVGRYKVQNTHHLRQHITAAKKETYNTAIIPQSIPKIQPDIKATFWWWAISTHWESFSEISLLMNVLLFPHLYVNLWQLHLYYFEITGNGPDGRKPVVGTLNVGGHFQSQSSRCSFF